MRLTSLLYAALRVSRDINAAKRGPKAVAKRAVRKAAYRGLAKVLSRALR
jgi:hypothetical protein